MLLPPPRSVHRLTSDHIHVGGYTGEEAGHLGAVFGTKADNSKLKPGVVLGVRTNQWATGIAVAREGALLPGAD